MLGSFFKTTLAASLFATLVACGGGGGDSGAPLRPAAVKSLAEGAWNGITPDGNDLFLLVLDSGEMFGIASKAGTATDLLHATNTVVSGNALSAISPRLYTIGSRSPSVPVTLSGTVNASSMGGTIKGSAASKAFNLARASGYESPVQISMVVGTWTGTSSSLMGVYPITNLVIQSSGAFTAQDGPCQVNGTITPRGNVAVYDVSASYVMTTTCTSSAVLHGIAGLNNDGKQLIAGLITSDRSNGGIMILNR